MMSKEIYEKELAKVVKATGLTSEQVKALSSAMSSTWQEIGSDWLEAMIGHGSRKTISRAEVIEAVTDADCLKTHVQWRGWGKDGKEMLLTVINLYYKMDEKKQRAINEFAFPFKRYGW